MRALPLLLVFLVLLLAPRLGARELGAGPFHLGVAGLPEWQEFAAATPHGRALDLTFTAAANAGEHTLLIHQRNVKASWNVLLNGRKLGALETLTQPLVLALRVPAGLLRDGENRLTISRTPSPLLDDIVVRDLRLEPRPRDTVLGDGMVDATVIDADTGLPLPARLTWVDPAGALAPLLAQPGQMLAVRTGVIYTGDGRARFSAAAGEYVLYASRGFEYSAPSVRIRVRPGETQALQLALRREVPTPGLVAVDTHIHTFTHSRHGDATEDERMLTIAGEGIELAVATDHNHHVDYTEATRRTGLQAHFRPVIGNEVSTKAGHFNAFPIRPGAVVPDAQLTDWNELLPHIRAVTGAQVITLNHPRDVHQNFTPLGPDNFDAATGAWRKVARPDIDALEVVTSAALQSDPMLLYRDWFALLNHGFRITAIGASDTHHVSEFILGQARTYVAAPDADPTAIDVDAVCASLRAGRAHVSMGLLTILDVQEAGTPTSAKDPGDRVQLEVRVLGPSWSQADRVELFANGSRVRVAEIEPTPGVEKARVRWTLPWPRLDTHFVAIATGPGVTAPFWEIPPPYQAASKERVPRVIGSTNPHWLDSDRDGKFTSAREYAQAAWTESGGDAAKFKALLARYDEAVAAQAAAISR